MRLLRRIDEKEEKRECARGHCALLYRKAVDSPKQILERGRAFFAVPARPGCDAQLLDDLEGLLTFQSLDDATQGCGEPANIFVKR
jgi:hypothetical protein